MDYDVEELESMIELQKMRIQEEEQTLEYYEEKLKDAKEIEDNENQKHK